MLFQFEWVLEQRKEANSKKLKDNFNMPHIYDIFQEKYPFLKCLDETSAEIYKDQRDRLV